MINARHKILFALQVSPYYALFGLIVGGVWGHLYANLAIGGTIGFLASWMACAVSCLINIVFDDSGTPMRKVYLKCRLSDGQFSNEYAVCAEEHTGQQFSLFAEKRLIKGEGNKGLLEVEVIDQRGDYLVVLLPSEPFGGSRSISVRRDQVEV